MRVDDPTHVGVGHQLAQVRELGAQAAARLHERAALLRRALIVEVVEQTEVVHALERLGLELDDDVEVVGRCLEALFDLDLALDVGEQRVRVAAVLGGLRSEERRVGKECSDEWWPYYSE